MGRKHKQHNSKNESASESDNDSASDSKEHCKKTLNCCQINKCLKKYPSLPVCPGNDKTKVMVCVDDKIFWVPRTCIVDPDCEHTYRCLCDIEKEACSSLAGQLSLVKDRDDKLKWIESRCLTECNLGQLQCCLSRLPELGEATCTICWNLTALFADHMMYPKPWTITAIFLNGDDYYEESMYGVPFSTIEELEQILLASGWFSFSAPEVVYCITVQGSSVDCGLSQVSVMSGNLERASKCDQKPKQIDCCNPDKNNQSLNVFCQTLNCECKLNECADLQLIYRTSAKSYAIGSLDKIWECACIEISCETACFDDPHVAIVPYHTLGPSVSLSIEPRGNGFLSAQKPDNTIIGGNCRGRNAIDLQMGRESPDQVASGRSSVIVGGLSNKVNPSSAFSSIVGGTENNIFNTLRAFIGGGRENNITTAGQGSIADGAFIGGGSENKIKPVTVDKNASNAVVVGGILNESQGPSSVVVGGFSNVSRSANSFVGAGATNEASNYESVVAGGLSNRASGPWSGVLGGRDSQATQYGQQAHASGLFNVRGDAQTGQYVLRNITTNSVQTPLFLDGPGGTEKMVIPENSTWTFEALITARGRSGPIWAGYEIRGIIENNNGVVVMQAQLQVPIGESDVGLSVITGSDAVNDALDILVTGLADETIQWVAFVRTVETIHKRPEVEII